MASSQRKSLLERLLSIFSPVHGGEGGTVLLLTANVFLLLTAYYIIKPVREALILASWGAEAKIYASAGQAVLLLAAVPLYGRLAARVDRRRLITTVLVFFAACLGLFYILARARVSLGIPFYLWVGIFNVMVVAQFWSFANDIYTPAMGKRLFPIVGFGASSGAVVGSLVAGRLIAPLGVYQLLLVSAFLLLVSLVLTLLVDRSGPGAGGQGGRDAALEPLTGEGGFTLVLRSRYLQLIAAMMILANLVNTTGEYVLGKRVAADREQAVPEVVVTGQMTPEQVESAQAERRELVGRGIGEFYAGFFSVVNLAGLLTQLFLVSRIVQFFGVRWGIRILPLIAMGSYALMALFPVLAVARWGKTAENATDYSLQNTVRNMLFLPTSRQEKYKAKQAIDTFFMRAGDVLAGGLVLAGTTVWHLSPTGFALANVVLAGAWLALTVAIARRFRALSR
jgi:AAA family ATP:ADP antiporter